MMKSRSILLFAIFFSILYGCGSNPKPKTEQPEQFKEENVKLNDHLQRRIGSWAKEGTACYGLVLLTRKNKSINHGKSVKIVIVRIKSDSIKVKVLEDISLAKTKDCAKMSVSVGNTWWESEGELFLTREEADAYLKAKGWEFNH